MNVIIAGSRTFNDYEKLRSFCDQVLEPYEDIVIFSGKAKGVDKLGEKYAKEKDFPLKEFPAQWNDVNGKPKEQIGINKMGGFYWKLAGFSRNLEMAQEGDMLIAFWDGKSKGTKHMIATAKKFNVEVEIYKIEDENIGSWLRD